jgi:nucleoside-diphosphate-sugar epimerase
MRVLFIGGTGNISLAVTRLLAEQAVDLTVLNREQSDVSLPDGVRRIRADVRDRSSVAETLRDERFDVIVDWIAYSPHHIETDIELFRDSISQYVFISSATVYRKPSPRFPLVEEAPLGNDNWHYARGKIACEERLRDAQERAGFPITIVRPSHTYGETRIPTALDGEDYTVVDRLLRGKRTIVPGDGTALWTMTHSTDFARAFVGILGNTEAVGESYHITSDEVLTWNQITDAIAVAAGLEPAIIHIPSDFINAIDPELGVSLLDDKSHSLVFDNSKIKRLVPDFTTTVPFTEGIARSLAWFNDDPARRVVNWKRDALLDRITAAYESGRRTVL